MKKLLLLVSCLLVISCTNDIALELQRESPQSNENFISLGEALQTAENVFAEVYGKSTTRSEHCVSGVENYYCDNLLTRSENEDPDFYIVNYGNEEGFALLSADRRRNPIYAFSDTGHLHVGDTATNPGLKSYMESIGALKDSASTGGTRTSGDIYEGGTWNVLVSPLLTEQVRDWDQFSLNKYVKNKNGCTNAPVGCSTLAMGQIMSYQGWPERWPIHNYDYNHSLEKYDFDWSVLRHKRTDDKLARLMEILGRERNLNARYNNDGSAVKRERILPTFINMGYQRCDSSKFMSNVAANHLMISGPFMVCGRCGSWSDGVPYGHAWTIDGLCEKLITITGQPNPTMRRKLYYHFVWGHWGGGNGYYYFDQTDEEFNPMPEYRDEKDPALKSLDYPCTEVVMIYNFKRAAILYSNGNQTE